MAIMRLFSASALVLTLVGCGLIESITGRQPAATLPAPVNRETAEPRSETRDTRGADALFNEFFDVAPVTETATDAPTRAITMPEPQRTPQAVPERNFTFTPNGRFVVQVSTIASPELANNVARRFERMGYPAYVARVENPTLSLIGTFFRVRIGGFARISEANNFGESVLRPLGYDFWVDNRSNDHVGMGGDGLGFFDLGPTITTIPPTSSAPAPTPAPVAMSAPAPTAVNPPAQPVFTPMPISEGALVADAPFNVDAPDTAAQATTGGGWDDFEW